MTDYYVDAAGNDANLGTAWGAGNSWATLYQATLKPVAAGDRVFVKNNITADNWTTKTYGWAAGGSVPVQIYSVASATTNTPPVEADLAAGATITVSGSGGAFSFSGSFYLWGFTLVIGTGTNAITFSVGTGGDSYSEFSFDNCTFDTSNTSGQGLMAFANSGLGQVELLNPTIKFGAVNSYIRTSGPFRVKGGAAAGPAVPTNFFSATASYQLISIEGMDLSLLNNTSTIFITGAVPMQFYCKDCKTNAASAPTLATTPSQIPSKSGMKSIFSRTDSSGSVNQFACFAYEATETRETSITRVGGGADFASALFTKKIVTTANCKMMSLYEAINQSIVNTATGASKTVTVYGTINAAAVPNNNDIWLEVEYPKDSGDPLGGYKSSEGGALSTIGPGLSPLGAASAVSADGSTWNGGGSGAGWSPFKLTVTFTPQLAGPLTVRVYVAKASTTYYLDPAPVVT